ncbi:MAG: glycosyltransferase family 2 protein [Bacteroidia bacterium]
MEQFFNCSIFFCDFFVTCPLILLGVSAMLSICIPVYQFGVVNLVNFLHQQAEKLQIPFEIWVIDDASGDFYAQENQAITQLSQVKYQILPQNIGRSAIRNLLAHQAKYPHLLFMDCDSMPENENYLANYLQEIGKAKVICGGRTYASSMDDKSLYLRWLYGVKRECKSAVERNIHANHSFMTNNFLIQKEVLLAIPFNTELEGYGHEDTLLGYELQKQNISILHIDNPLRHIGLETADIFIQKTTQGIYNLQWIVKTLGNCPHFIQSVKLLTYLHLLKKYHLSFFIKFLFQHTHSYCLQNLRSEHPRLWVFDFYKLGIALTGEKEI